MTFILHTPRDLEVCMAALLEAQRIVDAAPRDKAEELRTNITTFQMQMEKQGHDTGLRSHTKQPDTGIRAHDEYSYLLNGCLKHSADAQYPDVGRLLRAVKRAKSQTQPCCQQQASTLSRAAETTQRQCRAVSRALILTATICAAQLIGWMI